MGHRVQHEISSSGSPGGLVCSLNTKRGLALRFTRHAWLRCPPTKLPGAALQLLHGGAVSRSPDPCPLSAAPITAGPQREAVQRNGCGGPAGAVVQRGRRAGRARGRYLPTPSDPAGGLLPQLLQPSPCTCMSSAFSALDARPCRWSAQHTHRNKQHIITCFQAAAMQEASPAMSCSPPRPHGSTPLMSDECWRWRCACLQAW
jgi:hypothetical protein